MSAFLRRSILAILSLLVLSFTNAVAQNQAALSAIDRTRLAEAFRLGDQISDRVWPGWSKAPFAGTQRFLARDAEEDSLCVFLRVTRRPLRLGNR